MTRVPPGQPARRGLPLLAALALAACGREDAGSGPVSPELQVLPALIVSDPEAVSGAPGPVYTSLPPGSIAGGDSLVLTVQRTGAVARIPLVDGGYDPVALTAVPGDSLRIALYAGGAGTALAYAAEVPADRPPVIVRTEPPPTKPDVPLNATLRVVVSEPLLASSLQAGVITLLGGGTPVPVSVAFFDAAHLVVAVTPVAALQPGTAYTLVIGTGLTDLAGDPLPPVQVPFATATAPPTPPSLAGVYRLAAVPAPGPWNAADLVLSDTGTFALVLRGPTDSVVYPGRYVASGQAFSLYFNDFPGWWYGSGTASADTLQVTYNAATVAAGLPMGRFERSGPAGTPVPSTARQRVYRAMGPGPANPALRLVLTADGRLSLLAQVPGGYFEPTFGSFIPAQGDVVFGFVTSVLGIPVPGSAVVTSPTQLEVSGIPASLLTPPSGPVTFVLDTTPVPAPPPGRIAFRSTRDGADYIYTANPDGTGLTRLVPGRRPRWSWDGQAIAYMRFDPLANDYELRVMAPDGGGDRSLGPGRSPAWSPDGARLLYTARDTALYVVPVGGGAPTRLLGLETPGLPVNPRELLDPSWSPDGREIAFTAKVGPRVAYGTQLVVVARADGTNLRAFTATGDNSYTATWLGTGHQVLAAADSVWPAPVDPTSRDYLISAFDPATGQRTTLYRHYYGISAPSPGPGDRQVAFVGAVATGSRSRILVLDMVTGLLVPLFEEMQSPPSITYDDLEPDWTRQ